MHESDQMVRRALDAGASGYLLKSDLTECVVKAVKAVSEGKRFLAPKVSEIVLEGFLKPRGQRQKAESAGGRNDSAGTRNHPPLGRGESEQGGFDAVRNHCQDR
jgi:DNA-binding NarL/FixJ family response regulator